MIWRGAPKGSHPRGEGRRRGFSRWGLLGMVCLVELWLGATSPGDRAWAAPENLSHPSAVTTRLRDGSVYVQDKSGVVCRIFRYDNTGQPDASFNAQFENADVRGMAYDGSTDQLWILVDDALGSRIVPLEASTGRQIADPVVLPPQIMGPQGMAFNDQFFSVITYDGTVWKYDRQSGLWTDMHFPVQSKNLFGATSSNQVSQHVYVVGSETVEGKHVSSVWRYDGVQWQLWVTTPPGDNRALFGVTGDHQGQIFTTDTEQNQVVPYYPCGTLGMPWPLPTWSEGIVWDPYSGLIYVTGTGDGKVYRYTPQGNPFPWGQVPPPRPTPSPTPVPSVTPAPTATPALSPTPVPSPTPAPSPTPVPSATPTPSPTPVPSPTPSPTPVPVPSATPTPTPSPTPPPVSGDKSGEAGDPVNTATGSHYFAMELFSLGGALPLTFEIYYQSDLYENAGLARAFAGKFGLNWVHNFLMIRLADGDTRTRILYDYGKELSFEAGEGGWVLKHPTDVPYQLKVSVDGKFHLLDPVKGRIYTFGAVSRMLERVTDRSGNALTLSYDGGGRLSQISDGLGRILRLAYNAEDSALPDDICQLPADGESPARCYLLSYDGNLLTSLTDLGGNVTRFEYDPQGRSGLLTRMVRPRGNAPTVQTYDAQGRVAVQRDALGHETTLVYSGASTTVTRPDGSQNVQEHAQGNLTAYRDDEGNAFHLGYDAQGRKNRLEDREGGVRSASTGASGFEERLRYEGQKCASEIGMRYASQTVFFEDLAVSFDFSDPVEAVYPGGISEQLTWNAAGKLVRRTDGEGHEWRTTYTPQGLPARVTNPQGGESVYTYDASGRATSFRTSDMPDGSAVTYGYDAYGRLESFTTPGGGRVTVEFDGTMDRIRRETDQAGHTTTYERDANGNLLRVTDALGKTMTLTYDAMDRLISVRDRTGAESTYTYDAAGHLQSTTNGAGEASTYAYDGRGFPTAVAAGGSTWHWGANREGQPLSLTPPGGGGVTYRYDDAGRLGAVVDPLGNTTESRYNERGLLAAVTDGAGRTTEFSYSGNGLLESVTLSGAGTATVEWSSLGVPAALTLPGGGRWTFATSPLGRLERITDPLGQFASFAYDQDGRLTTLTSPGGGTLELTHDAVGHVTEKRYGDGTRGAFTYDALGRMTGAGESTFTYDHEGRLTGADLPEPAAASGTLQRGASPVHFGATYDAAGRMTSATYDTLLTVRYEYNAAGLLSRVSDTRSGASVTFTYDAAGRLTAMTRSNGVEERQIWDGASRLTEIRVLRGNALLGSLRYTLSPAGDVVGVEDLFPGSADRTPSLGRQELTVNAACRITSPGYAYDLRGRMIQAPGENLSWDDADRLRSWERISGGQTVAAFRCSYDALGNLTARTEGNATVAYLYHPAYPLPAPAMEVRPENLQKSFVWTPWGTLLYAVDPEGNPEFYVFDREGNTRFITGADGQILASYAYDPRGLLTGSVETTPSPFTFAGKWGTLRGGPASALFWMRSRWYDGATGRFLTPDPAWPDLGDFRELNPYAYARGNPLRYADPSGNNVGNASRIWKEIKDIWGLVKPSKTQVVGNTTNGTPQNFVPGGAEISAGEAVGNVTGGAMAAVLVGVYTDAVGIPADLLMRYLTASALPEDREALAREALEKFMNGLEMEYFRMSATQREAFLKDLQRNEPELFQALKWRIANPMPPQQLWNGPFDPFRDRPEPMPKALATLGQVTIVCAAGTKMASDGAFNTVKNILAWPFKKIGEFSSDVGHVVGAGIYGDPGDMAREMADRFPGPNIEYKERGGFGNLCNR